MMRIGQIIFLVLAGNGFALGALAQPLPFFPDSDPAHLTLKERECPARLHSSGQLACHDGLAGQSAGKTCLVGVNWKNGFEREENEFTACVIDCVNPKLRPDAVDDCNVRVTYSNACFSMFSNKTLWRSAGDLNSTDQQHLRQQFDELLRLIKSEHDSQVYAQLGGDSRRLTLKQSIVKFIFSEMTPYASQCLQMRGKMIPFEAYQFPNEYDGPGNSGMVTGMNALGPWLNVYENVFYDQDNNSIPTPDVVAAAFIHEAVHWQQPDVGLPEAKYILRPNSDAFYQPGYVEVELNELMAYDRSRISTFYKLVLTPKELTEWSQKPLSEMVKKFDEDWGKLRLDEKKSVAKWAWGQPDEFMRYMMSEYPGEDGGAWGKLCAANTGQGVCGMIETKH